MAGIDQFLRLYSKHKTTFKETSYDDDNEVSLCKDETQKVINFDEIIAEKFPDPQKSGRPKSFDAVYIYDRQIYCIEFKNQKYSDIASSDIREKFESGREELDAILQEIHIQKKDYDFIYCVCYKECIEPRERYKCGIAKGIPRFGLAFFKEQNIVKNVFTNNVTFFKEQLQKKLSLQLHCN